MTFLLTFLLGCVDGLRSLTPPALVCWAAHFGWLHFAGTRLAFINDRSTLIVFTLLALAELIADKLPSTPARTAPLGLTARIVFGGACGLALATSAGTSLYLSVLLAAIGAIVGAFAGYHARRFIVSKLRLPDIAVAVVEDLVAIAGGLLILYCARQMSPAIYSAAQPTIISVEFALTPQQPQPSPPRLDGAITCSGII